MDELSLGAGNSTKSFQHFKVNVNHYLLDHVWEFKLLSVKKLHYSWWSSEKKNLALNVFLRIGGFFCQKKMLLVESARKGAVDQQHIYKVWLQINFCIILK